MKFVAHDIIVKFDACCDDTVLLDVFISCHIHKVDKQTRLNHVDYCNKMFGKAMLHLEYKK
jgi:hypothetical protein